MLVKLKLMFDGDFRTMIANTELPEKIGEDGDDETAEEKEVDRDVVKKIPKFLPFVTRKLLSIEKTLSNMSSADLPSHWLEKLPIDSMHGKFKQEFCGYCKNVLDKDFDKLYRDYKDVPEKLDMLCGKCSDKRKDEETPKVETVKIDVRKVDKDKFTLDIGEAKKLLDKKRSEKEKLVKMKYNLEKYKYNYESSDKIPAHIIETKKETEKDTYNFEGSGNKVPNILLQVQNSIQI